MDIITSCVTAQAWSLSELIIVKEYLPSLWCLATPVHHIQVLMTQTRTALTDMASLFTQEVYIYIKRLNLNTHVMCHKANELLYLNYI